MNRWLLTPVALVCSIAPVMAQQFIDFTQPNATSIQFDDTLASSGGSLAWSNGTTVPGVFAFKSTPSGAVTNYVTGNGTSSNANLYSFGLSGDADRALGSVAESTTGNFAYGVVIHNVSGGALSISLGYTGEQWRVGNQNATQQSLQFSYGVFSAAPTAVTDWDPSLTLPTGYTALSALNFNSLQSGGIGRPLNGNDPANRTIFSDTAITTVQNNEYLVLRWFDFNDTTGSGADHGLAIDDLNITAITPVPEPATAFGLATAALGLVGVARRRFRVTGC